MYDTIIIGAGPAGMTAALYALRSNKSVLILEKENFGGQISNSPKLENYPSIKTISGLEFSNLLFEQIVSLGATFELEEVLEVKKEKNVFVLKTNYHIYESKTVIIATGLKHRLMNLKNEENLIGNGISFCAICDGPMYSEKETVIIGDGNTALQYALFLSNSSKKVHLFTLYDKFFADNILIDRLLTKENIVVTHNMNLIEYKGINKLEGLVFESTIDKTKFEIQTDNVFICIGQIPQANIFLDLVDIEKGFIITNNLMETKTPGLFACGDIRKKDIRQCITACNDGAIAGLQVVKFLG